MARSDVILLVNLACTSNPRRPVHLTPKLVAAVRAFRSSIRRMYAAVSLAGALLQPPSTQVLCSG